MNLTSQQRKRICKVLASSFTKDELRRIVAFSLNTTLEKVVGSTEQDLDTLVFNLVDWSERNNFVFLLLSEAYEHSPRNEAVSGLYAEAQTWFGEELARPSTTLSAVEFYPTENAESAVTKLDQPRTGEPTSQLPRVEDTLAAAQNQVAGIERAMKGQSAKLPPAATQIQPETTRTRSLQGTGLTVKVQLHMGHLPMAIYDMLNDISYPFLGITLTTSLRGIKRVRISSYIEGYSAHAVDTLEVKANQQVEPTIFQRPILIEDKVRSIYRLTQASLNIVAEDLDSGKVDFHQTIPIWISGRETFPLAVYNPATLAWMDVSQFLGAFVTPNDPTIRTFAQQVLSERKGDASQTGYQGEVHEQVRAIYNGLKTQAQITCIDSSIYLNPEAGVRSQRLRMPSDCLAARQTTSLEGAVLFATLLEAISLNAAIVLLPTHAIIAWEAFPDSDVWRYLDTTKLDKFSFDQASEFGEKLASVMKKQMQTLQQATWFRQWSLRQLREEHGIYPIE